MRLLKKLTMCDSPSGNEAAIREILLDEIKEIGFETSVTATGSVVAHKPGAGRKIMFDAHMDEIGVIATYIDDNGFVRFGAVGGLYTDELRRRRVRFSNGTVGVIGAEDEKFDEKAELSRLYIDIGAKDKKAALRKIKIGDTAVFDGTFLAQGDTIISKALDNRAGCYVLLKTMQRIKDEALPNDLYFVFSTQEEVGLRGAKTAAFGIMPDYAVAVDVTDTGDTPSAPVMDVKLGAGAAVKVMDYSVMCDTRVISTLRDIAEKNRIPYQNEIMADGGTDAGAIALTGAGVRAGGISIPTRYIHSPSELASKKDIEACIELAVGACRYKWE